MHRKNNFSLLLGISLFTKQKKIPWLDLFIFYEKQGFL